MAELILQTKLNMPPLRAGLVPRPRLMDKLNVGLRREDGFFNRKLTLVSAPAGFGKTTLVSYWLQENRESTAWISLDEWQISNRIAASTSTSAPRGVGHVADQRP
jgi:LuxR family maltose regulon positive regulatory protein